MAVSPRTTGYSVGLGASLTLPARAAPRTTDAGPHACCEGVSRLAASVCLALAPKLTHLMSAPPSTVTVVCSYSHSRVSRWEWLQQADARSLY